MLSFRLFIDAIVKVHTECQGKANISIKIVSDCLSKYYEGSRKVDIKYNRKLREIALLRYIFKVNYLRFLSIRLTIPDIAIFLIAAESFN